MKLGGTTQASCKSVIDYSLPSGIEGLYLWYRAERNLTSDNGESDIFNLTNPDKIKWDAEYGGPNQIYNNQNWNKPKWNTTNKAINLDGKFFGELSSPISFSGDFTFCVLLKLKDTPSNDGIFGYTNDNVFEITNPNTISIRIGGLSEFNFTEPNESIIKQKWYSVILSRTSGKLNVTISGDGFSNKKWGGSVIDNDTLTIETIGSWNGDNNNLNGYIKDLSFFTQSLSYRDSASMHKYMQKLTGGGVASSLTSPASNADIALRNTTINNAAPPSFTPPINTAACTVLSIGVSNTPYGNSHTLHITNPVTGSDILVNHPLISNGELAKFGDKFWIMTHGAFEINEFELDINNNVTHIRTIGVPTYMYNTNTGLDTVNGMAAKDLNTLIVGSVDSDVSNTWAGDIYEIDISGTTATWSLLFNIPGHIVGDLVYIPSSNTIATVEFQPGISASGVLARHYSYSGTLLGEVSTPSSYSGFYSMFCYDGEVFIGGRNNISGNDTIFWFDINGAYTMSTNQYPLPNMISAGDSASSTACCDSTPQEPIAPCYEIGDIGPEGGIVFAVPYTGQNQTQYYFEAYMKDVCRIYEDQPLLPTNHAPNANTPTQNFGQTGCEWGMFKNMLPPIYPTLMGEGYNNTISLNALTSPSIPSRGIAAKTAISQTPPITPAQGAFDWHLPSAFEWKELIDNLGPNNYPGNPLDLETQFPASVYWTSSNIDFPGFSDYAMAGDTNGMLYAMNRDHVYSVRPVRMFECKPGGIEYNYRYVEDTQSNYPTSPARMNNMRSSATPNPYFYANLYMVDPNAPTYQTDVIGDVHMMMFFSKKDAVNNTMMPINGSIWKFKVYNQFEEILGEWEYKVMQNQMCGAHLSTQCSVIATFQLVSQTIIVNGNTQVSLWDSSNSSSPSPSNKYAYIKASVGSYPSSFADTINLDNYLGLGVNNRTYFSGGSVYPPVNNNWYYTCNTCISPGGSAGGCKEWFAEFTPPINVFTTLSQCTSACSNVSKMSWSPYDEDENTNNVDDSCIPGNNFKKL